MNPGKADPDHWIDLSLPIRTGMPVYPGDPPVSVGRFLTHEHDGIQASAISLSCHAGTHVDVPRHFLPDGAALESISPGQLTGTAFVAAAAWTLDGLIDLRKIDVRGLHAGDGLLLSTGWEKHAGQPAYYADIPQFASGSSLLLLDWGIRFFGIDLPTVVEKAPAADTGLMHRNLLHKGILIIESLCDLQRIVGKRVRFYAFPLLLPGCEGSPVRACACLLKD